MIVIWNRGKVTFNPELGLCWLAFGEVRLDGTFTVSGNKALQKWMGKEMFDFFSVCLWRLRARVCGCKSFRKDLELDSDKTHYFSGRN